MVDGRYGNKMSRIKSAIMRLDDYLSGRISSLPELEEKRLPFNGYRRCADDHGALISGFASKSY